MGHKVKVRLKAAVGDRRNVVAVIRYVDGDNIGLDASGDELVIHYGNVAKARLIVDF